jgi:hypothetical protein
MTAANQREYAELRRFVETWGERLAPEGLPPELRPAQVIAAFEQRSRRPLPLSGLRQALGDILEDALEFAPDQIVRADAVLREAGAPTLTQMLLRRAGIFRAIVRRGRLRNDTEFYLVTAALQDTAADLGDAGAATLNRLVADYESGERGHRRS